MRRWQCRWCWGGGDEDFLACEAESVPPDPHQPLPRLPAAPQTQGTPRLPTHPTPPQAPPWRPGRPLEPPPRGAGKTRPLTGAGRSRWQGGGRRAPGKPQPPPQARRCGASQQQQQQTQSDGCAMMECRLPHMRTAAAAAAAAEEPKRGHARRTRVGIGAIGLANHTAVSSALVSEMLMKLTLKYAI
ncbi:proline-rich proteoglycan 2-like [Podarcis raffonei]|uniref:proline-rich proteoglycan 2-like n=1 Tax=Podarcis raffonei TaxID=65483 RepID=UPI0023295A82|nr:proline-rich proteoglycan 2-like [Podarcis raffonei]